MFIEFLQFKASYPDRTLKGEAIAGINQGLKEVLNDQSLPLFRK